ncbi:hypothetical protein LCGC14_0878420 [marine sediment metagenome]|uniref:MmcB family DNA repair protein n=1 Tax=marine sediment metagenome TaxID=412755 RepID=A0A0F9PNA8_9ZZZZ
MTPTHAEVVQAAAAWLHDPFKRLPMIEIALPGGALRADVLAWAATGDLFFIVEAKASRTDFRRGHSKFAWYRDWCDRFYVAAPVGLIDVTELEPGIGLLEVAEGHPERGVAARATLRRRPRTSRMDEEKRKTMVGRVTQRLLVFYEKAMYATTRVDHEPRDDCPADSLCHYQAMERRRSRLVRALEPKAP